MSAFVKEYGLVLTLTIWVVYMTYSMWKNKTGFFEKRNKDPIVEASVVACKSLVKTIEDLKKIEEVSQSNVKLILVDPITKREVAFSPDELKPFSVQMSDTKNIPI